MITEYETSTFEGTVQTWGNSLGLRITRPMQKKAGIHQGDTVRIEATAEGLVIRPIKRQENKKYPYTEAELLKGLTAHFAHADELPNVLEREWV
jgi:antitoxin MazE